MTESNTESNVRTLEEVDARLRQLYGVVDWAAAKGVVHVASIVEGDRSVIIPGPMAPVSKTDRFVLGAARARVDAILTTGAILRSEPGLRHEPSSEPVENAAFLAWRRQRIGRNDSPQLIVMTESGDLPLDHPAIRAAEAGFVWTSPGWAAQLRSRLGNRIGRLEIVEASPSKEGIAAAIERTMAQPEVETVLIEAGPRAAAPLYSHSNSHSNSHSRSKRIEGSASCDELLLSGYHGELDRAASGPTFVSLETIEACFTAPPSTTEIDEASGRWRFMRYRLC